MLSTCLVLSYAVAGVIKAAKAKQRTSMILLRCFLKPCRSLGNITRSLSV